jgi:hypothetical protein
MTHLRHAGGALAVAVAVVSGASVASAHDLIGIDLRPSASTVEVGDVVTVGLYAVREPSGGSSFVELGEAFTVLDLFFSWNPKDLRLIGASASGAAGTAPQLISSGFVNPASDYTGTNEATPPSDGTAYYSALALGFNPVYSSLEGTLVATLSFQVLREFDSTDVTPIESVGVPNSSVIEYTKVLDAAVPGYDSTGSLGSATFTQGEGNPCPANLVRGPSSPTVDGADLAFLLAAWGATDSAANLVTGSGSPTVDGADLAFLLAAWGSCGD